MPVRLRDGNLLDVEMSSRTTIALQSSTSQLRTQRVYIEFISFLEAWQKCVPGITTGCFSPTFPAALKDSFWHYFLSFCGGGCHSSSADNSLSLSLYPPASITPCLLPSVSIDSFQPASEGGTCTRGLNCCCTVVLPLHRLSSSGSYDDDTLVRLRAPLLSLSLSLRASSENCYMRRFIYWIALLLLLEALRIRQSLVVFF